MHVGGSRALFEAWQVLHHFEPGPNEVDGRVLKGKVSPKEAWKPEPRYHPPDTTWYSHLCSAPSLVFSWSKRSSSDRASGPGAAGRTQDTTLKELEEAQKLGLVLRGDHEKFRKLFAPLCRALPELPKLRVLVLDLGAHFSRFGPGPSGLSERAEREESLPRR